MRRTTRWAATAALACAAWIAFAGICAAASRSFTETFDGVALRDAAATTAAWDTAAAEVHLPPFPLAVAYALGGVGDVRDLDADGAYLALADVASGLRIVDASRPDTLVLVSSLAMPGSSALGVAWAGSRVLVAAASDGLVVVDATNVAAPLIEAAAPTVDTARDVAVRGARAAVAAGFGGVELFDVSGAVPESLSVIDTPGYAFGVAWYGTTLLVADGSAGLRIYDATDARAPVFTADEPAAAPAQSVSVRGTLARVAAGASGVVSVDVADPGAPALAGIFSAPGVTRQVATAGDILYLADVGGVVTAVDARAARTPSTIASATAAGSAWALAVRGARVYVAAGAAGVVALEAASRGAARPGAAVAGFGASAPAAMAVDGPRAVVAEGTAGVSAFDVAAPESPRRAGRYDSPGEALDVALDGAIAVVADGAGGVRVLDVSDVDAPALLSSAILAQPAKAVAWVGDLALVCDGAGVVAVDLARPAIPAVRGSLPTPGDARDVVAWGQRALVLDGGASAALHVIDASVPDTLRPVASAALPGDAVRVVRAGRVAYALGTGGALYAVNLRDAAAPATAATVPVAGALYDLVVDGARAWVASDAGLVELDLSDPLVPAIVDTLAAAGVQALAREGSFVFSGEAAGVRPVQVLERRLDAARNVARSLALPTGGDEVVSVRLGAARRDSVAFRVSADGGATWADVPVDTAFHRVATPGTDLRWEATLALDAPRADPALDSLTVEWLGSAPAIDSVRDVPGDAGGWVRLAVSRSGYDVPGESDPVTHYVVYRRIAPASRARVAGPARFGRADGWGPAPSAPSPPPPPPADGLARIAAAASGFPPGTWEATTVAVATQSSAYSIAAPTLSDSTGPGAYTVFVVVAMAQSGAFWVSAPDSGYSHDDTADRTPPAAPTGVSVYYDGAAHLSWSSAPEPDALFYRVYRDTVPGFALSASKRVQQTFATAWTDTAVPARGAWYAVTVVDTALNESAPAYAGVATAVGAARAPVLALAAPAPNPFGASARVDFVLPREAGRVRVDVFDAAGRRVRRLVEGRLGPGVHRARWDGRDERGARVASGVYFVRLATARGVRVRRVVVVR